MSNFETVEVFTPPFRVAFANLAEPDTFPDKPEYNLRALFDKKNPTQWIDAAIYECAQKNGMLSPDGQQFTVPIKCQLKDGDLEKTVEGNEPYDGHPGHWFLKLVASKDKHGNPMPMDICDQNRQSMEAKEVYNGCWVRALIRVIVYNHEKFGKGITARCDNLQFLGHDAPFSTGGAKRVNSAKAFDAPIEGLPSHVTATPQAAMPGVAPQAAVPPQQAMPGVAPQAAVPPQQAMPGVAPQAAVPPQQAMPGVAPQAAVPPQQAMPGVAPQAAVPPQQAMPGVAPQSQTVEEFTQAVMTPPTSPQMGPNAQGFTYEQWKQAGHTDEQMKQQGIIL